MGSHYSYYDNIKPPGAGDREYTNKKYMYRSVCFRTAGLDRRPDYKIEGCIPNLTHADCNLQCKSEGEMLVGTWSGVVGDGNHCRGGTPRL